MHIVEENRKICSLNPLPIICEYGIVYKTIKLGDMLCEKC